MKLFYILVFFGVFLAKTSFAQTVQVPRPGSVWESLITYASITEDGPVSRKNEVATVDRLVEGRPVFTGEVFGYKGEIIESTSGTVVYTHDCKGYVPAEMLTPPPVPNQCVWHVCAAPAVGETFTRPMIFFVPLYACQGKAGTYTFTSTAVEQHNGKTVTVGEASIKFGPLKPAWKSYIQQGMGEVHAVARGKVTTYHKVSVTSAPYVAVGSSKNAPATPSFAFAEKSSLPEQCDLVAFGDSLTEGLGASKDESYPAMLGKYLDKTICNLGQSGDTTAVAKERLGQILLLKPKAVFLALGANDALVGVAPAQTRENLVDIVDAFLKEDIIVVVLSFESVAKSGNAALREMLAVYEPLKGRDGVIVLPYAFDGVFTKEHLSSDGMHPNASGYKKLAENVGDQSLGLLRVIPSLK